MYKQALDELLAENTEAGIDYIHGTETLLRRYLSLAFFYRTSRKPACSHRYCAQACYRAKLFQWTSIEKCYYLEARRIAPDD